VVRRRYNLSDAGNAVTLNRYHKARTPRSRAEARERSSCLYEMVEPMGVEPTTSRVRFQSWARLQAPLNDETQSFQPLFANLFGSSRPRSTAVLGQKAGHSLSIWLKEKSVQLDADVKLSRAPFVTSCAKANQWFCSNILCSTMRAAI
jgi:hypothetical protein